MPDEALDWLLQIGGIVLIIDGGIVALPLLLGKSTRRLWKVVLLRELFQIVLGVLLVLNQTFGFDLLALVLGLGLLFWGGLELILFVEVQTSALHRRGLLLPQLRFFSC